MFHLCNKLINLFINYFTYVMFHVSSMLQQWGLRAHNLFTHISNQPKSMHTLLTNRSIGWLVLWSVGRSVGWSKWKFYGNDLVESTIENDWKQKQEIIFTKRHAGMQTRDFFVLKHQQKDPNVMGSRKYSHVNIFPKIRSIIHNVWISVYRNVSHTGGINGWRVAKTKIKTFPIKKNKILLSKRHCHKRWTKRMMMTKSHNEKDFFIFRLVVFRAHQLSCKL